MYAIICTQLDIAHTIGLVSRFLLNIGKDHWDIVKWIFRYLKDSSKMYLCFGGLNPILRGYTDVDVDMTGNLDTKKSTPKCMFTFAGAVS